jgi:GDP-L-fucose synthase
MKLDAKIYVAGHRGLVGSAIVKRLKRDGYRNLILRTHAELDLTDQAAVRDFFSQEAPEHVFLAAAKVGGILANDTYPVDFIADNLAIELNVISAAHAYGVKRLMFLGSSCIYPKHCSQPMKEEYLLTGSLESTNEPYAIAKIAGIKMCEAYNRQYGTEFVSVMPTNLYGPDDNFDLENSHVLPALIRKFHEAKQRGDRQVVIWGSGTPKREFLYVDDMAEACVFIMGKAGYTEIVNIGVGEDIQISELAGLVGGIIGFEGDLVFDSEKPD